VDLIVGLYSTSEEGLTPTGIRSPDHPARSESTPTELSRLRDDEGKKLYVVDKFILLSERYFYLSPVFRNISVTAANLTHSK
jgi:hypothetical protein